MLTEEQRVIFREILDLNWEFSHTEENWGVKWDIARKVLPEERRSCRGDFIKTFLISRVVN